MTKVAVRPEYPPDYPHSNRLNNHSGPAKKAYEGDGSLPQGVLKTDAAVNEHYQDDTQGHADAAKSKTNNRSMKKPNAKTIGSKVFQQGADVVGFVKQFDPSNTSGSIPFALNLIKQIQSNSGVNKILGDVVGQGMGGLISKFTGLIKQGLPSQAMGLANVIQQGLQLKQQVDQLVQNPASIDPQQLSNLQQQLAQVEQQIDNLNRTV